MSYGQLWGRRFNLLVLVILIYSASTILVLLYTRDPGSYSDTQLNSKHTGIKSSNNFITSSFNLFVPRKISSLELDEKNLGKWKAEEGDLERVQVQVPTRRTVVSGAVINSPHNSSWQRLLDNIFIAVKSTKRFHEERLKWVLDTWCSGDVADKVHVFTDKHDETIDKLNKGVNIVETNCSDQHNRPSLCCKMGVELDTFLTSNKNWFCHVDDDNYVNVPLLVKTLSDYSHHSDIYIGRPSLDRPIEVQDRLLNKPVSFWFATGGAGFCISRSLAYRMSPYYRNGAFVSVCERVRLPDDCTVGFVIESILDHKLTVDYRFHSHLEPLSLIKEESIRNQLTLSYGSSQDYSRKSRNIVSIDHYFNETYDPTRFKSIHCIIHPSTDWCL